ncbi:LuxR C-terminal-related transcriptional regulator [Streptomyces sp. NPDC017095]|uniref:helix-turn-helix transcriptional regulator n=1 Tax=Streptomyces sp. NPDC017095 TaxID=3364977 RepID=UPI0037A4BAD3
MSGQTAAGFAVPRCRPGLVTALLERLGGGGACVVTGEPGSGRSTLLALTARAFGTGRVVTVPGARGSGAGPVVTVPGARGSGAGPVVTVPDVHGSGAGSVVTVSTRSDQSDPRSDRFRQPLAGLRALCRAAGVPTAVAAGPVRRLIGALEASAAPGTVLLCVDDADLWDTASRAVLGRLAACLSSGGGIALLLTVAGHRPVDPEFVGLPLLRLAPLSTADAAALLDAAAPVPLDPWVREEISAAAEGNPGLLLGVLQRLTPAQLGGAAPLPRPLADAGTLTALAGRHLTGLPPLHRDMLLVTAAAVHVSGEPAADAEAVHRATARLAGAAPDTALPPTPPVEERPGRDERPVPLAGRAPDHDPLPAPRTGGVPSGERLPAPRAERPADTGPPPAPPAPRAGRTPDRGPLRDPRPAPPAGTARPALRVAPDGSGAGDGVPRPGLVALPEALFAAEGRVGFRSAVLCRAVYAGAPAERRRAAHAALARVLPAGPGPLALLHRSWTRTAPAPALAAGLADSAADPASTAPPALRCTALTRAAELASDGADRVRWHTAAAEQALLAGRSAQALRLLDTDRGRPVPAAVRARAELLRGTVLRWDGPVDDARETLLLAGALSAPYDTERSAAAALAAADAAWSAGDVEACLRALAQGRSWAGVHRGRETAGASPADRAPEVPLPSAAPAARDSGVLSALRDHCAGMRAVLHGRFDRAGAPLRRVVDRAWTTDDPEELLRAASAALLLGDIAAARRAGARALAVARTHGSALHEARALEYLAYGELRAGRHASARAHAEEGLRSAYRTGQRNTAAHHHAVLALAASIAGEAHTVADHATAAMTIARRHGLAQAAALAQWAMARADLGHGRPREAAERLAPLVRPGSGPGHFAVWMLAVPCYVEACALARQPEGAGDAVEDFAAWAACDADPQAAAQLLRCRALLAAPEDADPLYRQALRRHGETAGDFERARTELLYGKWLRRRRRLREARSQLRAALLDFERCGAGPWAQQAAAELRANGVTGAGADGVLGGAGTGAAGGGDAVLPDELARLTPQQLRIARRVAQGLTNREVALSLSVSTRTVDYHLRKVFAALGVRSRVELARLVEQAAKTVVEPRPPSRHTSFLSGLVE